MKYKSIKVRTEDWEQIREEAYTEKKTMIDIVSSKFSKKEIRDPKLRYQCVDCEREVEQYAAQCGECRRQD